MEKHFSLLSRFRLLPRPSLERGWIAWAAGSKVLSYERYDPMRPEPADTDTAFLSFEDYLRVTTEILTDVFREDGAR